MYLLPGTATGLQKTQSILFGNVSETLTVVWVQAGRLNRREYLAYLHIFNLFKESKEISDRFGIDT